MNAVETKVSYVAADAALQAAWNEEPECGYMLTKRMGDGSLRVYPVSVRILSLEHREKAEGEGENNGIHDSMRAMVCRSDHVSVALASISLPAWDKQMVV